MSYWIGWSAGSWGSSWGDDVEVDESWDTSQGAARNLANNLKYRKIQDTEQRLSEQKASSAVYLFTPTADAEATFAPCGAHFSFAPIHAVIHANAFATFSVDTTISASGLPAPSAECSFAVGGHSSAGACGSIEPTAGAEAALFVDEVTTAASYLLPHGVVNPSDEEMGAMLVQLLSNRRGRSPRVANY